MVEAELRGINTVRKRLANGRERVYYYHRATGQRLPGKPGDTDFLAAYAEAERIEPRNLGDVASLISKYLRSVKFAKKRDSTQREYKRILAKVETRFGKMPIKALESPKVRAVFLDYQEEIGRDRPREADNRLTVLSAVFSHAKRRGEIPVNPLEGFERLHHKTRADMIWTEGPIERFMATAPVELQRAMVLAMHTGQRYGDLIRLRWSDYDGASIRLIQRKTAQPIHLPCTSQLRQVLDSIPRQCPYILARADGRPWFTAKNDKELSKQWTAHMKRCGLHSTDHTDRLEFADLRGTAVTMMAEAGCSVPQIVAVTGHTLQSATRILERYMARTSRMAEAAILHFENAKATEFANRLQTADMHAAGPSQKTKGKQ